MRQGVFGRRLKKGFSVWMSWAFLMLLGFSTLPRAAAIDSVPEPVWWFGVAGAANLNFYGGTLQQLNSNLTTPVPFHKGFGVGLYLAPTVEYRPDSVWGGILQVGVDDRRGDFRNVTCPCGDTATLSAKPAYLSIEPSLRVAPFVGDFHVFAGPRVGFLWSPGRGEKTFHYTQGGVPTNADFSSMRRVVFSGQIGMGYDFTWAPENSRARIQLSPFISYQPPYGEAPRYTDHWGLETVRLGAALKFGLVPAQPENPKVLPPPRHLPDVGLTVQAPSTVISRRKIQETFPLRNYVFFEEGSSQFSDRYFTLTPAQAADFREEQLQDALPAEPTGRSRRQMTVYHNILNIIGDRLRRNPGATIVLRGNASQGPLLGKARAETVKHYLTEVFGIAGERIGTEGGGDLPYGHVSDSADLPLLRAEHQRVEILSHSPELLVQIGEGDHFMLKPVQLEGDAEGTDSVVFHAPGAERLASWHLEITDGRGVTRDFGPYTGNREALPAPMLLGENAWGAYTAGLVGRTADGDSLRRQAPFRLSRKNKGIYLTTRFAILFDFDQAAAVSSYEKFLTDVVTAQVPDSGVVFIRGRTDVVGETDHNFKLSQGRAEGVRHDLDAAVSASGRRDVGYQSSWTGEDPTLAPFGNASPEERSYNRTVIIDILPY